MEDKIKKYIEQIGFELKLANEYRLRGELTGVQAVMREIERLAKNIKDVIEAEKNERCKFDPELNKVINDLIAVFFTPLANPPEKRSDIKDVIEACKKFSDCYDCEFVTNSGCKFKAVDPCDWEKLF